MADAWARSPDVLSRRGAQRTVLLPPGRQDPLFVSGAGVAVWELLDPPVTVDELVRQLSDVYGMDADTVEASIAPLLEELLAAGAVVRTPRDDG